MGVGNLVEINCLDLASLGLKGNKTYWWRGARGHPHLLELPVYISSAHTAFSRLLAQLPHILLVSTPSLLPGATNAGTLPSLMALPQPWEKGLGTARAPKRPGCLEISLPFSCQACLPS